MAIIVGDDGQLEVGKPGDDPTRERHRKLTDDLAFHFEMEQQAQEALDGQHQTLAARVAEMDARVAFLEALIIGSPAG